MALPRLRYGLAAAAVFAAVVPATASAQQSRTYVDRAAGSDANDCLYESPCLSFQRAHDATVAGGEVNVKTPGNYSSLTISKPITIDGNGNVATITPFGMGVNISLPGGTGKVVLRDIRINAGANLGAGGVDMLRGGTVILDNVRIFGGSLAGIRVQNQQDPVSRLVVDDTKIQGTDGFGITIEPRGTGRVMRAVIRDSKIDDNGSAGVRLRPAAGATARATVRNVSLDGNLNGVVADSGDGGVAIASVLRSAITDSGLSPAGSGVGVFANGANATARIARNEIQFNQRGLQALNTGRILSAGDNDIFGNVVNGAPTGTFGRQ